MIFNLNIIITDTTRYQTLQITENYFLLRSQPDVKKAFKGDFLRDHICIIHEIYCV